MKMLLLVLVLGSFGISFCLLMGGFVMVLGLNTLAVPTPIAVAGGFAILCTGGLGLTAILQSDSKELHDRHSEDRIELHAHTPEIAHGGMHDE